MKSNLPVLLLKGIILLPKNEIRLEFDNTVSKNVLDISQLFHESSILVASTPDLVDKIVIEKLPKIGVIANITHRIELPNGKTRVVLKGVKRAKVHEYLNTNKELETMESIISELNPEVIDEIEENILVKKISNELEKFVHLVPKMGNGILNIIQGSKSLSELTDMIAPFLPIKLERLNEYLHETNSKKRAEFILSDIYKEEEIYEIEKKIDLKVKQQIDESQKEYVLREKIKQIREELGDTNSKDIEIEKIREKMESLSLPPKVKDRLESEIKRYETLSSVSPEVGILRTYIDWLLDLPWQIYTDDNKNLKDVRKKLDESHFGIEEVKKRIIEFLAVRQFSKDAKSPILCLVGPPGVGKTTLAFSVAKALNRNFAKISVGGINDPAEIIGHRKTYLGASPGRIMQSIKKAKSSNPLFLIDEVDKMAKDIKGDPASSLLDVLDIEQNEYFIDNYIEEEFDLSKVIFILTANYIENIPEPLKDRLEIINLSGYTEYEKLDICKKHIIKNVLKEHALPDESIHFDDDAILQIIRGYTKESGVRELNRKISTIIRKIVTSMVVNKIAIKTLNVTCKNLDQYLGKPKYLFVNKNSEENVGVVNGLAYTNYGGDTLPIEVTYFKGKGDLVLTGSLGDVMKESAHIAIDYIKSNSKKYHINENILSENDIHIHVPEGAVPKDGPSAGIALTTSLISALINKKVSNDLAMTGEITLRGKVLPIGGLKEKSIGAYRNNIKKIIIPHDNISDLKDIPEEIKKSIEFVSVSDYKEVYKIVFGGK